MNKPQRRRRERMRLAHNWPTWLDKSKYYFLWGKKYAEKELLIKAMGHYPFLIWVAMKSDKKMLQLPEIKALKNKRCMEGRCPNKYCRFHLAELQRLLNARQLVDGGDFPHEHPEIGR